MMEPSRKYDVVGLGVSTLDLLMLVDEFPNREMVQHAQESALAGGGPIATAMVTLARLGAKSAVLDRLGDDWRGKLILDEFEREGVSTGSIVVSENRSSSIASILVRKDDGARTITYSPGDVDELSSSDIPEGLIASARILHLNGRHLAACMASAKQAKEHAVLVSFDGGAHRYRDSLDDLINLTDVCIVAREFAFSFSGQDGVQAAAARLHRAGPRIVVITAGVEGSWVFERGGGEFHQPAFKVDTVVDTTGAGDAYHGAFLFGMARGWSLPDCVSLASAVAAMNTRQLGGRRGLPSLDEARQFLVGQGIELSALRQVQANG